MKIDEVLNLDKQFQENDWMWYIDIHNQNFSTFKILKNKSKIMISALHSVKHIREWEVLSQDLLTGWLTLYLWKRLNLPVIYSTSYRVWDPNFDENKNSEYKQTLAKYIKENDIKLLIDLHGCWSFRDFSIELGTWWDWNPNLLGRLNILNAVEKSLNDSLKSYIHHTWKYITRNTIFPASRKTTVSAFISKECKVSTIQIEINKELRDMDNLKNLSLLINTLENLIKNLIMQDIKQKVLKIWHFIFYIYN